MLEFFGSVCKCLIFFFLCIGTEAFLHLLSLFLKLSDQILKFPDTFSLPYGFATIGNNGALVSYKRGDSSEPAGSSHYADNQMTKSMWELLEEKGGCAFLPAASCRIRSGGANVALSIGDAAYWSEDAYTSSSGTTVYALCMVASDENVGTNSLNGQNTVNGTKVPKTALNSNKSTQRKNGLAVRLIRDVN